MYHPLSAGLLAASFVRCSSVRPVATVVLVVRIPGVSHAFEPITPTFYAMIHHKGGISLAIGDRSTIQITIKSGATTPKIAAQSREVAEEERAAGPAWRSW